MNLSNQENSIQPTIPQMQPDRQQITRHKKSFYRDIRFWFIISVLILVLNIVLLNMLYPKYEHTKVYEWLGFSLLHLMIPFAITWFVVIILFFLFPFVAASADMATSDLLLRLYFKSKVFNFIEKHFLIFFSMTFLIFDVLWNVVALNPASIQIKESFNDHAISEFDIIVIILAFILFVVAFWYLGAKNKKERFQRYLYGGMFLLFYLSFLIGVYYFGGIGKILGFLVGIVLATLTFLYWRKRPEKERELP